MVRLLFSLQAVPRAEELPAVVVVKLSTDGVKDVGAQLSRQFISVFIQVSSILVMTQYLQPFKTDEQTEHLTSCQC